MAFQPFLSAQSPPEASLFVLGRTDARLLRPLQLLPVVFAVLWVFVVPASTLFGWLTGQLQLVVTLLGVFLLFTVSCASVVITALVVLSRSRRNPPVPSGPEPTSPMVELAPAWSTEPKSAALTQFLQNFEDSLSALRVRLLLLLGEEMARSLPLHQQIGFAAELEIWTGPDIANWRVCLAVRTAILTEGADVPLTLVNHHARWLEQLNQRTVPSLSH